MRLPDACKRLAGWLALNFRVRAIYASFLSNLIGMDWRYGALHFMRHLIDGDCPIDHYQWAQQAGCYPLHSTKLGFAFTIPAKKRLIVVIRRATLSIVGYPNSLISRPISSANLPR